MTEIILQAIVEKLERLETVLLRPQAVTMDVETRQAILNELRAFRSELSMIAAGVEIGNEKANKILLRLDSYALK